MLRLSEGGVFIIHSWDYGITVQPLLGYQSCTVMNTHVAEICGTDGEGGVDDRVSNFNFETVQRL